MLPLNLVDLLVHSGLDLAQPFTTRMAEAAGIGPRHLTRLVAEDLLQRPLKGVFRVSHLPDTLELRLACLRLVVPPDAVITDRTAGWLHGAPMILAPGDHLQVPAVSAYQRPGNRLRNAVSESGERRLTSRDIVEVGGLAVTSPLRTACDLGRLLHRDSAFAALDSLLALGAFSLDELVAEVLRFPGYRGVCQLRAFAPLAVANSESFGESVLRLRWYDACLADRPEPQIEVHHHQGYEVARLDIGSREHRYAAEYDGEEFHGPDDELHDRCRRAWISEQGWVVDVFRREDVFGRHQNAIDRLAAGFRRASLK